jgi:probable phosphoglycerate mutase
MTGRPELLLLRHGETEWNAEVRFQGSSDSALTETGRAQAAALGGLLQRLGVGPDTHVALTSSQGRAVETARLALGPLGIEARHDPRLVEIGMGSWTGLTRQEIEARWPGPEREPILAFYARCPDGERLEDVAARAGAVLAGIDAPTVIVAHGITLRVLCALALGRDLAEAEHLFVPQGRVARIMDGQVVLHMAEP